MNIVNFSSLRTPKWSFLLVFILVVCLSELLIDQGVTGEEIIVSRCCQNGFQLQNGKCIPLLNEENETMSSFLSLSESSDIKETLKTFILSQGTPECSNGSFPLTGSLSDGNSRKFNFTLDGYIKYGIDYYSPEEYCINRFNNEQISVHVCKPECSSLRPCIQKCCDLGEVWDLSAFEHGDRISCKPSGTNLWKPTFYTDPYTKLEEKENATEIRAHYISSHPRNWCNDSFTILSLRDFVHHKRAPFRILQNGSVVVKVDRRKWHVFPYDQICVDGAQNYPTVDQHPNSRLYSGEESDTMIIDCRDSNYDDELADALTTSTLYVSVMIIACIFLFLTSAVFILLWKHQNLHGWTILGHIISLFFQYVFIIAAHLHPEEGAMCDMIAIVGHFFFISSFTWLTMINFNIWWTFWKMSPTISRKTEIKQFIGYSLFAVGIPITIVSVGLSLDYVYRDDPDSEIITPMYGRGRCFIDPEYAQLPYLYGPIGFLLTANLIFFFATLFSIHKALNLANAPSKLSTEKLKQKVKFFSKLFVVVGITWIFEIVSWASTGVNETIPWYWVMFDLINVLQAVAIFFIFVCNKETLYNLEQRFNFVKKMRNMMHNKMPDDISSRQERRQSFQTQASIVDSNPFENVELK